jgi:2-polyprenyl-6-methoxyphenol hydroxylase-like FAD-dependent oxidoreductase
MDKTVSEDPLPVGEYAAISAAQDEYPEPASEPAWSSLRVSGGMHHVRYDKCDKHQLPVNFAALGDAIVRVNPIFGQGCGKGAMDVATLDGVLRKAKVTNGMLFEDVTTTMAKVQAKRLRPMFDLTRYLGQLGSVKLSYDCLLSRSS